MHASWQVACVAVALVACDRDPDPPPPETPPALEPPPAAAEPSDPPPPHRGAIDLAQLYPTPSEPQPSEPGPPGPAYFAVDKLGVVRLDESGFTPLPGSPTTSLADLQIGGDGALWLRSGADIYRHDGATFQRVAQARIVAGDASLIHFTVTPNGTLWAASDERVGRWDGAAWTLIDRTDVFAREYETHDQQLIETTPDLRGVAIDADGHILIMSTVRLRVRTAGTWRDVDVGVGDPPAPYSLVAIRTGRDRSVSVLTRSHVRSVGPGPVTRTHKLFLFDQLAVAANGTLAAYKDHEAIVLPPRGEPHTWTAELGLDYLYGLTDTGPPWRIPDIRAHYIEALAVDDTGRIWIGADTGVTALGPGDERSEWPLGSVPALVGRIAAIAVVDAGPAVLPPAGEIRTGSLTGTLVRDGKRLAHARVELCHRTLFSVLKDPCVTHHGRYVGRTDARGVWRIDRVPLGKYTLTARVGDEMLAIRPPIGRGMRADQAFDVGLRSEWEDLHWSILVDLDDPTPFDLSSLSPGE